MLDEENDGLGGEIEGRGAETEDFVQAEKQALPQPAGQGGAGKFENLADAPKPEPMQHAEAFPVETEGGGGKVADGGRGVGIAVPGEGAGETGRFRDADADVDPLPSEAPGKVVNQSRLAAEQRLCPGDVQVNAIGRVKGEGGGVAPADLAHRHEEGLIGRRVGIAHAELRNPRSGGGQGQVDFEAQSFGPFVQRRQPQGVIPLGDKGQRGEQPGVRPPDPIDRQTGSPKMQPTPLVGRRRRAGHYRSRLT